MAYTPDPTDPTQPLDTEIAKTAAAEFRSLKGYVDTTIGDIITGNGPVNLHTDSTIGGQNGSTVATIGYRDIPRRYSGWARGECLVSAVDVELLAADVLTGYVYSLLNSAATNITFRPGVGVSLKVSGVNTSANFVVPPYTMLTVWCDTDTSAIIAAVAPINYADIISILGYTPYNATNPSGYLSAIDYAMVVAALGYAPPTPNGLGAVGTWPISISGNAATADNANTVDAIYYAQVIAALGFVPADAADIPTYTAFSVTSQDQAIPTATATIAIAHGAVTAPTVFNARWKCLFAEGGWSAGDMIDIAISDPSDNGRTYTTFCNASQWGLRYTSFGGNPQAAQKSSAGVFTLSAGNWRLVFSGVWMN